MVVFLGLDGLVGTWGGSASVMALAEESAGHGRILALLEEGVEEIAVGVDFLIEDLRTGLDVLDLGPDAVVDRGLGQDGVEGSGGFVDRIAHRLLEFDIELLIELGHERAGLDHLRVLLAVAFLESVEVACWASMRALKSSKSL